VTITRRRRSPAAGVAPLSPRKKWRAILLATLVLAPAFWAIIFGMVSAASDAADAPAAAPYIAFGLAVIPFVFVALAFLSEHPRAPGAAVKGMIVSLLVGIPVSALAQDAVTGLVAGLSAGGIFALRMDLSHTVKARIIAVVAVTVYCFFLLRTVSGLALLIGPALPFTSLGIADHLSERRQAERSAPDTPRTRSRGER
jgi:hypothetical protein